jgi:hypothetical protein
LLPHPVKREHRLLIFGLDGHEPHARTLRSFPDCRRVRGIVLVRLDEWPHELRCNEPHIVAKPSQLPCPMMSAATGFHHDTGYRPVGKER